MSDEFRTATVRFASGVDLDDTRLTGEMELKVAVREGWLDILVEEGTTVFSLPPRVVSWVKFEQGKGPAQRFMDDLLAERRLGAADGP